MENFNVGYENKSVIDIYNKVKNCMDSEIKLITEETNDNRSYHVSSEKLKELGFVSNFTIKDAIIDLISAFTSNKLVDPLKNPDYFNIKKMQNF